MIDRDASGILQCLRSTGRHERDGANTFVSRFARFGLAFVPGLSLGVDRVQPRAVLSTYQLASPAIKLRLGTDGLLLACPRIALEIDPHVATEHGRFGPDVDVVAQHAFVSESASISEFRITNRGPATCTLDLSFDGCALADDQRYMVRYFAGLSEQPRERVLERVDDRTLHLGLRSDKSSLPTAMMRWSLVRTSHPIKLTLGVDQRSYAFASPGPVVLAAGETARFQFRCDVITHERDRRDDPFPEATCVELEQLIDDAARHVHEHLGRPVRAPASALDALAMRARHALYRCGYAGAPDGRFGGRSACLCVADNSDFSCVFFWDTLFSAVAIATYDPSYAADAIRTAFVGHDDRDGSTPERKWDVSVDARMPQQSPQSPVASWAVRRVCELSNDIDLAMEMMPLLERNHAFWRDCSDADRDGLAEYRWSGQAADNSPLWDWYSTFDGVGGCGWLPPVASVVLNSFLYWDATELATLCRRLEQPAEHWETRAQQIHDRLLSICYDPQAKRFYDYNHQLRRHRRINNLYNYWPLVAGMNLPRDVLDEWIEHELLNPSKFFGPIPFPTVAFDEPEYDPRGYWRGKAWPHLSYWVIESLWRHGRHEDADEAANRILAWYSGQPGFRENMSTANSDPSPGGALDYNWGAASVLLLASRAYQSCGR